MSIKITTPLKAIQKFAEKQAENTAKIIRFTVSDVKKRAPGWIATEVIKDYNIKKSDMSPKVKEGKKRITQIKVRGTTISSIQIVYTGQRLQPNQFKMKPKKRPVGRTTPSGRKIKPKPYRVSYEVLKGHRTTLDEPNVFVGGNGGEQVAWRRTSASRYPIKKVVTIAQPQMIHNDRNADAIDAHLNEGIEKRLNHYIQRFSK